MPRRKLLPIINRTAKEELIHRAAWQLRIWSARYDSSDLLRETGKPLILGIEKGRDIKVSWGQISYLSGQAIDIAVSHVVSDAKPGTIGGALLEESEKLLPSSWEKFKTAVRKIAYM